MFRSRKLCKVKDDSSENVLVLLSLPLSQRVLDRLFFCSEKHTWAVRSSVWSKFLSASITRVMFRSRVLRVAYITSWRISECRPVCVVFYVGTMDAKCVFCVFNLTPFSVPIDIQQPYEPVLIVRPGEIPARPSPSTRRRFDVANKSSQCDGKRTAYEKQTAYQVYTSTKPVTAMPPGNA